MSRVWNKSLGKSYQVLSDKFNSFPVVQQAEHDAVHNGIHYNINYSVTDLGAATTPADMMTLSWTTPAAIYMHFIFSAISSSGALVKFIEGKTGAGADPTGIVPAYNSNRVSSQTSLITDVAGINVGNMSYDATLFTGGTTLVEQYIGSDGQGASFTGGESRGSQEWVLKLDTLYQLSIYETGNVPGTLQLSWYEYDGKNYR